MPNLYTISGCTGAGKTTSGFTMFPEILTCNQFINTDNIAAGISPFDPESVAIEVHKVMISYVDGLLKKAANFVLETSLLTDI